MRRVASLLHAKDRIVSTATVFFRRFYLRNSFVDSDPRLIVPACLLVASKAEDAVIYLKDLAHAAVTDGMLCQEFGLQSL